MRASTSVAAVLALLIFPYSSIEARARGGALVRPATPAQSLQPFGGFNRFAPAFSPFTGNFVRSAPGTFNPSTGAFTLSGLSNSILSSRRDLFLPTGGTFVPSSHGPFELTTRAFLNPATGTFTPATTGGLVFSTRGSFVPSAGGSVISNPVIRQNGFPGANPFNSGFSSPYDHLVQHFERNMLRDELANGLNPYAASNPYLSSLYGNYPYANPYQNSGYGSYPYSGYGGYPYSGGSGMMAYPMPGSGTGSAYPATNDAAPQAAALTPAVIPNAAQGKQLPVLAAFGIPSEFGEVQWPSAFRLLPPDKRELLPKLEAQLKIAATQAANGNASTLVLRQAKNTIDDLRDWLRERQPNMAESTNQDADRFLHRLNDSIHAMSP